MLQWWHFLMCCLYSVVQMKGTHVFAVLNVYASFPPLRVGDIAAIGGVDK